MNEIDIGKRVKCNVFPDHQGVVAEVEELKDPRLPGKNVVVEWDDGIRSVENSEWLSLAEMIK